MNKKLKLATYYGTRLSQVISKNIRKKRNSPTRISFYPQFPDISSLADQYSRIKWYLPKCADIEVSLSIHPKLALPNLDALPSIKHHRKVAYAPTIRIYDEINTRDELRNSNIVCVWDADSDWHKFISIFSKVRIIDPQFFMFAETHSYPGILWHDIFDAEQRKKWQLDSIRTFQKMYSKLSGRTNSTIFGTGPSISNVFDYDYSNDVTIICNSMVKNDQMLDHIKPDIIAFTDSVFHFGVSEYSEAFAKDVLKVVKKFGAFCITNEVGYAIMRTHYPELTDYLIAIPAKRFGKPTILSQEKFYTRDYENILTRYMLPTAAGLSESVRLIGFDGRNPSENYFWKHNETTQYVDEMESAKLSHPAFFRDISYDEYYDQHCTNLDKIFIEFEKQGKSISVLGKSFIPALSQRICDN